MKMYFFRGAAPNFGDELNEWLLPKVFPNFFDDDESTLFLGVGSVLFDTHPKDCLKVVFGSGYGAYTPPPALDAMWKVYCVRGPLTAETLGLSPDLIAGDTAILINRFRPGSGAASIRCSFMPHWQSLELAQWARVCELAGVHYIDPRSPVDSVLDDIQASKLIVTEAMHGAIVADALRVPWIAAQPFLPENRMKWFDWAGALDLKLSQERLCPSTALEAWGARPFTKKHRLTKGPLKGAFQALDRSLAQMAAARLNQVSALTPRLSEDRALDRALDRLETSACRIKRDFA
jgi:succinoglycan biosynthesis protein ExoV